MLKYRSDFAKRYLGAQSFRGETKDKEATQEEQTAPSNASFKNKFASTQQAGRQHELFLTVMWLS